MSDHTCAVYSCYAATVDGFLCEKHGSVAHAKPHRMAPEHAAKVRALLTALPICDECGAPAVAILPSGITPCAAHLRGRSVLRSWADARADVVAMLGGG